MPLYIYIVVDRYIYTYTVHRFTNKYIYIGFYLRRRRRSEKKTNFRLTFFQPDILCDLLDGKHIFHYGETVASLARVEKNINQIAGELRAKV